MDRAADPKRARRFFVPGGTERFSVSVGGPFRLRRGCGTVCRGGRGEGRRRRRGRMRPPLFCARRGGAAFRVGRCVGMSLFKGAAAFPPRWVGGSRVVRLVETAGQAVPVVFLCPGGGGRAPLALRLRGGTGPDRKHLPPPLPPSGRGGAAPGRSRAGGNRIMARE